MKHLCKICNAKIPSKVEINGQFKILTKRRTCLLCNPYQTRAEYLAIIARPIEATCKKCGKPLSTQAVGRTCKSCVSYKVRKKRKADLVAYKGGKCQICGYDKCVRSLCFHHLDSDKKDYSISQRYLSLEAMKREVDKCILLCVNCHGELHEGLIELPSNKMTDEE